MSKYPAVCLAWLELWREQWNNCIYFKMPSQTARFLARKHPFQFSYEESNYLARHVKGSCLKGSSWALTVVGRNHNHCNTEENKNSFDK